jgi:elongation of very long chain fatty acids protein 7
MESPGYVFILLLGVYLPFCKIVGPWLMRDRKPWGLRKTMIAYNAFQVAFSGYIFYEVRLK